MMTFLEACRAWKSVYGTLPGPLTILLEGEEESGSSSLVPFLEENAAELKASLALVCDTDLFDSRVPAITTMLRGFVADEVTIRAADRDLHSGMFGGAVASPVRLLAKILASLHDDEGRVTLPGFYEGVTNLPENVLQQWKTLGFDQEKYLGELGLSYPAGEAGLSVLEMIWTRPTCEFNGIAGGIQDQALRPCFLQRHARKFRFVS